MQQLLLTYLKDPNPGTFLVLRSAHLAQVGLNPYSGSLDPVSKLLAGGAFEEASRLISRHLIPNYLLSAGTHLELAYAYAEMGQRDKANFERYLATQLVLGIEMTGKGTERMPFLVTRTSDEYDYLIFRKQTPLAQTIVEKRGRKLDRIETRGGGVFWFDITEIHQILESASRRRSPAPVQQGRVA